MLALLGQHTGVDTKALENVAPWSASHILVFCRGSMPPSWESRSSVRNTTMLGATCREAAAAATTEKSKAECVMVDAEQSVEVTGRT